MIEVPAASAANPPLPPEGNPHVTLRVVKARDCQLRQLETNGIKTGPRSNVETDEEILEAIAAPFEAGRQLQKISAKHLKLTTRGYHRVFRVTLTVADLEGAKTVRRCHIAEALAYRG
ncbi:MAG: hypothetical protein OSB69_08410 [Alphaproteobacteria bacterium]|nr:hypothetical protein [Alphaproteobacteria bacterium]